MEIPTTVQGIPCLAYVTHYNPGDNGAGPIFSKSAELIDPGDPPDPEEIEFEILDRKGYQARWLERLATDEDWESIKIQISKAMEDDEP